MSSYCTCSENKLAAARKAEAEKTSGKVKQRKPVKSKEPVEAEPEEIIDYGEASTPAVGFFKGAVLGYVIATVAVTLAILVMILLDQDVV